MSSLVPFNLEEALANPERVVCKGDIKLVKWQHNKDMEDIGFRYSVATWFTCPNGGRYYSANKPDGTSIRNEDYTLYLKAQKKTIPFDESLLGKEGVRVICKYTNKEVFFAFKSDRLTVEPFIFETTYCPNIISLSGLELENNYVMEICE